MTVIPIYRPYVFLRCRKCGRKTEHVLINTATIGKGAIEENFECQQCGEIKEIYELASTVGPQPMYSGDEPTPENEKMAIQGLEEKIKAKREAVEQLESRKKNLEKRLKEKALVASTDTQQAEQSKEQRETNKNKKKKRKWF